MIEVCLLDDRAEMPSRGSVEAAGIDISIIEPAVIQPGRSAILSTGISMKIPKGYVGLLWPRSKLSAKLGADVLAGVIDSDYRGEIKAALLNTSDKPLELRAGDKVVQMIIQRHYSDAVLVEVDSLDETERGAEGINSSQMRLK